VLFTYFVFWRSVNVNLCINICGTGLTHSGVVMHLWRKCLVLNLCLDSCSFWTWSWMTLSSLGGSGLRICDATCLDCHVTLAIIVFRLPQIACIPFPCKIGGPTVTVSRGINGHAGVLLDFWPWCTLGATVSQLGRTSLPPGIIPLERTPEKDLVGMC